MSSVILDASALLAVIRSETKSEVVIERLPGALISSVNLCEVYYKAIAKGATLEQVHWAIETLPLRAVEFDEEQAAVAATLHKATLKHGLSFCDRACLALGMTRELAVLTSDQSWAELDIGVEVIKFR